MRGVAILMIIVGHVSGTMHTAIFTPLGGTGVALFLALSGFGLNESFKRSGLKGFWKKKILRVFLPYALIVIIIYLVRGYPFDKTFWLDVLCIKTGYWFIAYLVKWYMVFYLLTRFAIQYRIAAMLVVSVGILFLFPNIEAEQAFSFFFGVLASEKIEAIHSFSSKKVIMVATISFLLGIGCLALKQIPEVRVHQEDWLMNLVQCCIKLPLAIGIMTSLIFVPMVLKSPLLKLAGLISFELYLVHFPFYLMVNGNVIYALLLIVISFVVASLFYKFNGYVSSRLNQINFKNFKEI